jgi:WD40 repeat protein
MKKPKKHILPIPLILILSLFCTQCSSHLPVQPGTPVPASGKPITFWNAKKVEELAAWPDVNQDSVWSLAFSPDDQMLASGTYHGKVRLWRVSDGTLLWSTLLEIDPDAIVYTLDGENSANLTTVAFSPDGKTVAAISYQDGGIRLLNASDGTLIKMLTVHPGIRLRAYNIAFSPDGQFLAACYEGGLLLWRLSDGTSLQLEKSGEDSYSEEGAGLAFSPDGTLLASGYDWGVVTLWRVSDGAEILNLVPEDGLPREDVNYIAFLRGGLTFITGSYRYAVRLWRTRDGLIMNTWKGDNYFIWSLALSPASMMLAIGTDNGDIKLMDGPTHIYRATLKGEMQVVSALTFSSAGDLLASGAQDGIIRLWGIAGH